MTTEQNRSSYPITTPIRVGIIFSIVAATSIAALIATSEKKKGKTYTNAGELLQAHSTPAFDAEQEQTKEDDPENKESKKKEIEIENPYKPGENSFQGRLIRRTMGLNY